MDVGQDECEWKIWVFGDVWIWIKKMGIMRFIQKVGEENYKWRDFSSLNLDLYIENNLQSIFNVGHHEAVLAKDW